MNDHSLQTCHWRRFRLHTFFLFWSQQGTANSRRGPVALFGWTQTRRRLPCLSERQRSVHFYLTHWQASTQLSHTFHFRVYELACMQERTHARGEQEGENAHSCRCDGCFHFRWFHAFTAGEHLDARLKFIWTHGKCDETLINSCVTFQKGGILQFFIPLAAGVHSHFAGSDLYIYHIKHSGKKHLLQSTGSIQLNDTMHLGLCKQNILKSGQECVILQLIWEQGDPRMCVGALVKNRKSADKPANKQHRNMNIKYVFMGFNTSIQISG